MPPTPTPPNPSRRTPIAPLLRPRPLLHLSTSPIHSAWLAWPPAERQAPRRAGVGPLEAARGPQARRCAHGRQLRAAVPDALPEVWRGGRLYPNAALPNFHGEREVPEHGVHHLQGESLSILLDCLGNFFYLLHSNWKLLAVETMEFGLEIAKLQNVYILD